jgi:hypothetical protein
VGFFIINAVIIVTMGHFFLLEKDERPDYSEIACENK